jgi:hypothetical protein
MRIKIEIENQNKFLIEGWNWKKNQFNKKTKNITIKRMKTKLENITYHKLGWNDENKNKSKFYRREKNKN